MEQDPNLTAQQAVKLMQFFIESHSKAIPKSNFDRAVYENLKVRSATIMDRKSNITAKSSISIKVPPNYSNQQTFSTNQKTTHGAAVAIFMDLPTSITIVACGMPGWSSTGMTRRLDVTYLKPPVEGDELLLESEVIQIGKRLAVIRGVLKRVRDGVVLAFCQHDKYMGDKLHYDTAKMPDASKL